ncbi:MAG: DUF5606 domain-containing protein [Bacteroidales bacterium]|nr:MAG: DUF5606 domain-containing protein [Bacteroidales bacterium]
MDLKDILAISGQGGLYKFISQGRQGIIVESFDDKKRTCIYATQKVTTLEDIAIYTDEKEVPLADIFKSIFEKENGGETINHKSSPEELKKYMEEILPEYDRDRVYVSDIKKVVNWYNILHKLKLLKFDEKKEEKEDKKKKEEKTTEAKEGQKVEGKEEQKADAREEIIKARKQTPRYKGAGTKAKEHTKINVSHKGKSSQKV